MIIENCPGCAHHLPILRDCAAFLQIAGGSGLTPMLQVAQEVTRNPEDKTEVTLVFANVSEDDILLRKELDDMAKKHKNFKVCWHPQIPG